MESSPRWSNNTKLIAMTAVLAMIGFFIIRFQILIMPLIMAVILAYLLNPVVTALTKYLRLSRTIAVLLLYGILILLLIGLVGGAGFLLQQQLSGVLATVLDFFNTIPEWIGTLFVRPVVIGPFTFDLSTVNVTLLQDALLPTARDGVGRITAWMTSAASGVASLLGWTTFAFIVAYYLMHDMDAMRQGLLRIVPENYQKDVRRLLAELAPIWNAFLRGQLLLSLVMGVAIASMMTLLGLRYAVILGLLAALAEFVPILGANVVGVTAILTAFFQPSNWFGLSPIAYAVLVGLGGGLIQQLEANFLVPRVMGDKLKLHPAILIVGALVGFTLLGLPGLLLSGPIIATVRLFGNYMHAKMFNLPPWSDWEEEDFLSGKTPSVRIRPARESDQQDMLALTEQLLEGRDGIPQARPERLADREGITAAAEAAGRVVGIAKLSRLGPKEFWLEGLRVHPGYQGLKIGSQLIEHLIGEWNRRGGGVIRMAASSERVQVHHLCERLAFRRVEICRGMAAPAGRGACEFQILTAAEAPEAMALWKEKSAAWGTPHLVNDGWRWCSFTEDRMVEYIRRQRAWWWRERSGILLAYDSPHEDKHSLEVAALAAPIEKLAPMLSQLRVLAKQQAADRAAWVLPDDPTVAKAAARAGFASAWDAQLWIFERTDPPVVRPLKRTRGTAAKITRIRNQNRRR